MKHLEMNDQEESQEDPGDPLEKPAVGTALSCFSVHGGCSLEEVNQFLIGSQKPSTLSCLKSKIVTFVTSTNLDNAENKVKRKFKILCLIIPGYGIHLASPGCFLWI